MSGLSAHLFLGMVDAFGFELCTIKNMALFTRMSFYFILALSIIESVMKLAVPYFSLYKDLAFTEARGVCSIACAKMILDFFRNDASKIERLISYGDLLGARDGDEGGFIADGFVTLLQTNGFRAEKREFRNLEIDFMLAQKIRDIYEEEAKDFGVGEIMDALDRYCPVIISATHSHSGSHTIVLVGYEKERNLIKGFYYHDPLALSEEEGEGRFISIRDLKGSWSGTAVFVG
jgi:hypothetical protein